MSLSLSRLRRPVTADQPPEEGTEQPPSRRRAGFSRVRRAVTPPAPVRTGLALLLAYLALVLPDYYGDVRWTAFLRLPVEGLAAAAVLLALPLGEPQRGRRGAAIGLGVLLGLLALVKVTDLIYSSWREDRFDLTQLWPQLTAGYSVVRASVGPVGGVLTVALAVVLVGAIPYFLVRSALRLTAIGARHRTRGYRAVAVLTVVWLGTAAFGAGFADHNTSTLVVAEGRQISAGLNDGEHFTQQAGTDAYAGVPGGQLLQGLRGKDVLITFVESYGRSAIEDPAMASQVDAVLDQGTRDLEQAGISARSGFLTSSTVGGGSWLAHSTLMSGLWINNQQRFNALMADKRLTLPTVFDRAGFRTSSFEPAIMGNWPERVRYGYQKGYDRPSIGYHGTQFSYAPIPDQYTMAQLQKLERGPGHPPMMAEVTLVSSHTPFTPIPKLLPWDKLGNGAQFADPANRIGAAGSSVLGNRTKLRDAYRDSIEYTLRTLIQYVQHYGDKNLVLVFLGDHQPAPLITGAGASRDVPITIVARDPAVLDRIGSWNWTPGLRPAPDAPVWTMDSFRDKFLGAYAR